MHTVQYRFNRLYLNTTRIYQFFHNQRYGNDMLLMKHISKRKGQSWI